MNRFEKERQSRRRFLGLMGITSGSALLYGVSGRLASTVYGQTQGEGAFIVTPFNMGMIHELTAEGTNSLDWSLAGHPLADVTAKTMTIEDPYHPFEQGHGAFQALLSVRKGADNNNRQPGGISIDRQVARDLSGQGGTAPSVHVGYPYGHDGKYRGASATEGVGQRYPVYYDPVEAIAQYFGAFLADDSQEEAIEQAKRLAAQKASVLDFLGDDIQRMSGRLAPSERAGMDQYLTSVRELEVEAQHIAENGPPTIDRVCAPVVWDRGGIELDNDVLREDLYAFYYDLAGTALACGVTRVANVSGDGVGDFPGSPRFPFLKDEVQGFDPATEQFHEVCHRCQFDENRSYIEAVHRFRASMVRRLWAHLEAADLGDRSLADDSVLLWLNGMGRLPERGNHHTKMQKTPVVVLGDAGGKLKTGQVVRLADGERSVSDVFVTAAQAIGSPMTSFGDEEHFGGVIEEMLV